MALTVRANAAMLVRVSENALTDSLTGLGNRRRLMEDLDRRLEGEQRLLVGDLRPQRLQGLQRHVRPPGRRRSAGAPRAPPSCRRRPIRHRLPDGRRRVLRRRGARRHGRRAACSSCRRRRWPSRARASPSSASYGAAWVPEDGAHRQPRYSRAADQRLYLQKAEGRHSTTQQSAARAHARARGACTGAGVAPGRRRPALRGGRRVAWGSRAAISRRCGTRPSCTTSARLRSPTRSFRSPARSIADEWEFMRRHTLIGERILTAAPALEPVARIVRSTHESFDGSGYPDGLAGTEIPLAARIILVCDAFDAMTGGTCPTGCRSARRKPPRSSNGARARSSIRRSSAHSSRFSPPSGRRRSAPSPASSEPELERARLAHALAVLAQGDDAELQLLRLAALAHRAPEAALDAVRADGGCRRYPRPV